MHRPVGMYPTAFGKPPPPSELGPLNNMVPRGPPMPIMQPTGFGDNAVSSNFKVEKSNRYCLDRRSSFSTVGLCLRIVLFFYIMYSYCTPIEIFK